MGYHQGRLFDHVHLRVADVAASMRFYRAVLDTLGLTDAYGEGDGFFYADEPWVDRAGAEASRVHLAFQANDKAAVDRFYEAALNAGGRDNGPPGLRSYHSSYYAAYELDPDGNNIEAVWQGPTDRSAPSVSVERRQPA
jgi:catechol 2,3-dioxygenase-like lactoylglutathione lyase family enzyme